MKLGSIFLLLLGWTIVSHAQLSLSAGLDVHLFEDAKLKDFKGNRNSSTMDAYYNLQADFQKNDFRLGASLGLLNKSFDGRLVVVESDYWSHGQFSQIDRSEKTASVSATYLGLNLSTDWILHNSKFVQFSMGSFIQLDFLVNKMEYDHRDSSSSVYNGMAFNPETGESISYSNTTYYPTSSEPFDLVTAKRVIPIPGLQMDARFFLKDFFLDAQVALGFNTAAPRMHYTESANPYDYTISTSGTPLSTREQFFTRFGLSVGYRF